MKITACLVVIGLQVIWCLEHEYRIVGGQRVFNLNQAPYHIQYGLNCGGVLLSEYWAITAAHCNETSNYIVAGSLFYNQGTKYNICGHYTHPRWNNYYDYHLNDFDFQLLRLCTPVPCCRSRPAVIGHIGQAREGARAVVTGWGHVNYNSQHMEHQLRQAVVPVISWEKCRSLPGIIYHDITPRMFCAGYLSGIKDACQGDSGGPVTVDGKLVGLVSFGAGCAMRDSPGVYSYVPVVRPWIQAVTTLSL